MKEVLFFFDYACPYAYLASTQIEDLCNRTGATLTYKPCLLGGIFRALEVPQNLINTLSPAKAKHNLADMRRWADLWGVPFSMHPGHPVRTVEALRATLGAPKEKQPELMRAFYRAYWVDNRDISDRDVISEILTEVGMDGPASCGPFEQDVKDLLRNNTDEALAHGAFGVPAMVYEEQLYWGQDRLWMLEDAISGEATTWGPSSESPIKELDFFFDFSSPFAYLGFSRIEELCKRHDTAIRWRPMLLGAVFKSLGGPNVPLATFNAPKQRFVAQDLERWAQHWNIPLSWPSRFPMVTVKPLRIALALGDDMLPFAHACFRAYWSEDKDISDPAVLAEILQSVDQSPELIEAASDPHWKQALIEATQYAVDNQVFGAPTTVVNDQLFWGQDRLYMVDKVLSGWNPPV